MVTQPALANGGLVDVGPKAGVDSFRAADLTVTRTQTPRPRLPPEELRFGANFTDHMLVVRHTKGRGWGKPCIQPFQNLELHPAALALHYACSCFEGMKAYLSERYGPRLFRPDLNMRRLRSSAERLLLADFDPDELLECIKALLRVDRDWFIPRDDYAIYIRPCLFANSESLAVTPTTATTLMVILSPVGPYFRTGPSAVRLFVEEARVRAWPGGVGARKVAGNYAPTLRPQAEALQEHGCAQVLYTRPCGANADDALVSECGALNIFFLLQSEGARGSRELVTPALDDTILPGVTRDSLLRLAEGLGGGLSVSERAVTLGELQRASEEGRLLEIFGCGTACSVQPVAALVRAGGRVLAAAVTEGGLAAQLTRQLDDIRYHRTPHPWSVPVDK